MSRYREEMTIEIRELVKQTRERSPDQSRFDRDVSSTCHVLTALWLQVDGTTARGRAIRDHLDAIFDALAPASTPGKGADK